MALRDRLPDPVRAVLGRGRVLGWGHWQVSRFETGYVVATLGALHLVHGEGAELSDSTIPWDTVVRAQWNEPVLEVVHQPGGESPPATRALTLTAPGRLPDAVRERVTANIVMSTHVALVGKLGARFVARRRTDGPGVRWTVVFDAGLDSRDPALRAAAERELEQLRGQLGA